MKSGYFLKERENEDEEKEINKNNMLYSIEALSFLAINNGI